MLREDFYKLRSRSLLSTSRKELIQKNLDTLKQNAAKRTMAQNLYYEKHFQGRSPLCRDIDNKLPIHERLGNKSISKKKVSILGTSTNTLFPWRNRHRRRNRFLGQSRFSVQDRIDAIRQYQRTLLNTPSEVPSYKIQVFNNPGTGQSNICQRFSLQLDLKLQAEIKQIQNAHPRQIFHGLYPIMPVATHTPLHNRFSNLN